MALLKFAAIPKATYYYYVQRNRKEDKYKELKENYQVILIQKGETTRQSFYIGCALTIIYIYQKGRTLK